MYEMRSYYLLYSLIPIKEMYEMCYLVWQPLLCMKCVVIYE